MGRFKNFLLVHNRDFIISARFLAITGHLILVIMNFWSKDNNIRASLGREHSSSDFDAASSSMNLALSFGLILIMLELGTFFSGFTMFFTPLNVLSGLGTHAAATYMLYSFVNDELKYELIWIIFAALTVPSCALSIIYSIHVYVAKRY